MIDTSPASIAAVDLGSNSFHMIVADASNGQIKVIDRMREMVRLAAGLDENNELREDAATRAIECLMRFGERLQDLESGSVRVVGTNTLRKARNSSVFIAQAEAALGHPIDIISGSEEARLIYLGVSHGLEDDSDTRLVIDIGGGSSEFIVGRHFDPLVTESLHMGCVSMSNRFFADGGITRKAMHLAELAARQELEPIEERYRETGWQSAIGASGTNLAIRDVVIAHGWSEDGISKKSLDTLIEQMVEIGKVEDLDFQGLSNERRTVFAGGVAILRAAFEALGIQRMRVSDLALREGLLYDLLGRIQHEDVREQTIEGLIERYDVDRAQGERVSVTAREFWQQIAKPWQIDSDDALRLLRWAAKIHEIGSAISHSQYQKHGAYLVSHMDMPGFARGEQRQLAALVRCHRRKLPSSEFKQFVGEIPATLKKISVLLRLSIVLHRRRSVAELPPIVASAEDKTIRLKFPSQWLDEHPLTRADLEQEASFLKAAGFRLKFK